MEKKNLINNEKIKEFIEKHKEKLKNFIDKNKNKILVGTLAASITLSSIFGFAAGKAIGNKDYEEEREYLRAKSAYVEVMQQENQDLSERYQEALQAMERIEARYDEGEAEISEIVQALAECVENDEYGQGERLAFDKTVKVIEEYVNKTDLSTEDKQAIMTVVDNLEEDFISDNIVFATGNTFANDAVKVVQEEISTNEGEPWHKATTTSYFVEGHRNEFGIYHDELDDFSNVYIMDGNGDYTRCDVELTDDGKIINPTVYKEGHMFGTPTKDSFCGEISKILTVIDARGGEWSYDANEDCYTVKFVEEGVEFTMQMDLSGHKLEGMSLISSEEEISQNLTFKGAPKEEYMQNYEMIKKLIEEAKALQEEQGTNNGWSPSV